MKHQDKTVWLASQLPPLSCYGTDHSAQSVIEVSCSHILLNDMLLINHLYVLHFQAVFIFIKNELSCFFTLSGIILYF
jgi:hypothetical protein